MVYEHELISTIESALNKDYLIEKEVPMIDKFIDVVAIPRNPNEKEIIAIEAKINNWKRAIQQAITYRLCADKVYVAIWHEFRHRVDENVLDDFGIGLMEVNLTFPSETKNLRIEDSQVGTIQIIKEAKLNKNIHSSIRETVFGYVAKRVKNDGIG